MKLKEFLFDLIAYSLLSAGIFMLALWFLDAMGCFDIRI